MKKEEMNCSEMNEASIALDFYKKIVKAMRAHGVKNIMISLDRYGHLHTEITQPNCPRANKGKVEKNKYE